MPLPTYPGSFIKSEASPWSEYLHLGIHRAYTAGMELLHPGETCGHLYYMQTGEVLTTHYFSPQDYCKVNIIGKNAVAGLVELFTPFPPKASWRTLRPCKCVLFSRECVEKELPKPLLINLLEQAAYMSTTMAGRFAQGMNKRNDVRLARFLLHIAEFGRAKETRDVSGVTIVPSITQEISSELLGMHLTTFNKLLAAFRGQGIIGKSKKNSLEILDLSALIKYAEGEMPSAV